MPLLYHLKSLTDNVDLLLHKQSIDFGTSTIFVYMIFNVNGLPNICGLYVNCRASKKKLTGQSHIVACF